MLCNEVREALPLLDPAEPESLEALAHLAECAACAEAAQAYQADERAFAALRAGPRQAPLLGFADGVMARRAEPGPAAPLPVPVAVEPVATVPLGAREGQLIRLGSTSPWAAVASLAAALLITVGLGLEWPAAATREGVASGTPVVPVQPAPVSLPPLVEPGPQLAVAPAEALPAPARLERGQPTRGAPRGMPGMDVMPVDGSAGRGPRMRPQDMSPELRQLLERALPGLQRLLPPPPPARPDEVRF